MIFPCSIWFHFGVCLYIYSRQRDIVIKWYISHILYLHVHYWNWNAYFVILSFSSGDETMAWTLPSRIISNGFILPMKCSAKQFSTLKTNTSSHISTLFKSSTKISPPISAHKVLFVINNARTYQHFVGNFCNKVQTFPVSRNKFCIVTPLRTFSASSKCFGPSNSAKKRMSQKNKTAVTYILSAFIFMIGGAYAGVPLYKVFCQVWMYTTFKTLCNQIKFQRGWGWGWLSLVDLILKYLYFALSKSSKFTLKTVKHTKRHNGQLLS